MTVANCEYDLIGSVDVVRVVMQLYCCVWLDAVGGCYNPKPILSGWSTGRNAMCCGWLE